MAMVRVSDECLSKLKGRRIIPEEPLGKVVFRLLVEVGD